MSAFVRHGGDMVGWPFKNGYVQGWGMRRGEFESRVADRLGSVFEPYGFTLTPQPPADHTDRWPWAIFEAEPDVFTQRLPGLAARMGSLGEVSCIDVTVTWTGERLDIDLEGWGLDELLAMTEVQLPAARARSLDEQLSLVAGALKGVLERLSGPTDAT